MNTPISEGPEYTNGQLVTIQLNENHPHLGRIVKYEGNGFYLVAFINSKTVASILECYLKPKQL